MLVVADASSLIVLINIECVGVLPSLFEQVRVPPQVVAELTRKNRPKTVLDFMTNQPSWLIEQAPTLLLPLADLDPGERAAISLAEEIHADVLLIDEFKGRRAASRRNIQLTGTVGVLVLAAQRGIIDLVTAFDRIKQTDFWISPQLLDEQLALFHARKDGK